MAINRKALLILLLLIGLNSLTTADFMPATYAFPSTLTTDNTLFMLKFKEWYDYVHSRYDVTNVALNHANLTADEYNNALSRWTLAWHPLLLTFAYEKTNDTKYLMEAKYFVDNLYATTPYGVVSGYKSLVITPRNGLGGLLDADIPMVWAMENLNLFFGQSYNVTGYYSAMKTVAKYNNSTDSGWASPWTNPTDGNDVTFDEELITAAFLSYLTYKAVGNYTNDVQRMFHFAERYRVRNFYPYGVGVYPTIPRTDLTEVDMVYLLIAYHYCPTAISNSELQTTLNAYELQTTLNSYATTNDKGITEDSDARLGAMAELAIWDGFTTNQRLITGWYQSLVNFQVNNTVHATHVPEGERQNVVDFRLLLLSLSLTGRTTIPDITYGGFRNYSSHGVTNVYQLNNTISYNNTDIWGTATFEYEGIRILSLWRGIDWSWDAFAYNYTYGYYQGYKKGKGTLSGNDVKIRVWENFKKIQANHTNYNTNVYYPDTLASENNAIGSPCYLIFTNGTIYSLASRNNRTIIGSNPLAWYEPQNGYLIFYKINDNSSATMKWQITVSSSARGLSATAKTFEAIPWIVPARNPTDSAVTNKAKSLLSDYNNGQDMIKRDFSFSISNEDSIRWQLKHYSAITMFTDKNMTSSSYDKSNLTFTISAFYGQTSTTKVYCGPNGKPSIVKGADSWAYDDPTKILTITKLHTSAATITVLWFPPLTIDSCDSAGAKKDLFNPGEEIWVTGSNGYPPSSIYSIYVVNDTEWMDNMAFPNRIPGTIQTVTSNPEGSILAKVWTSAQPGKYDIVIDITGDGKYNAGIDPIENMSVYGAGFFVVPEYTSGTILALCMCFAGFEVLKKFKHDKHKAL